MSSYGLWLSAAGMKVNQHRQNLLANNLANINTTGFKHDLSVVTQRRMESRASADGFGLAHPVLDGLGGGVNVRPNYRNFGQGSIEATGRPLDLAIQGDGFFAVSDGRVTRYTRDGEFALDVEGQLVLVPGGGRWKVLDDTGSPIAIDRAGGEVRVSADGVVHQGSTPVASLGLSSTEDAQALRKVGENLFEAPNAVAMTPIAPRLVPEAREQSNFDMMRGLTAMIESSRAYQLNATMLQLQDELVGQAVSTVGRLN